jgi:hypothetical protein
VTTQTFEQVKAERDAALALVAQQRELLEESGRHLLAGVDAFEKVEDERDAALVTIDVWTDAYKQVEKERDIALLELKTAEFDRDEAEDERDAAYSVIMQAQTAISQDGNRDHIERIDDTQNALAQHLDQSLAKVKANALREAALGWEEATRPITGSRAARWLRAEADRIEMGPHVQ